MVESGHIMWKGKKVAVIFPTFREKGSIYKAIREFDASGYIDEIIVVDNNAETGTEKEVQKTRAKLVKEARQGVGSAIRKGIASTKAELLIIAEPDGTFSGKDVAKLLSYSEDFDTVFATRTHYSMIEKGASMHFIRRMLDFLFGRLINTLFLCSRLTDVGCILRLTNRRGWDKVVKECQSDGAIFITEWVLVAAKNNVKFIEIPVNFRRRVGKSSITETFLDQAKWAVLIFFYIWKIWFVAQTRKIYLRKDQTTAKERASLGLSKDKQQELKTMAEHLKQAPPIYQPSAFWKKLNRSHTRNLITSGLIGFKRSVNTQYFNWVTWEILAQQLLPIFSELVRGSLSPIFRSHNIKPTAQTGIQRFNLVSSFIYRISVAYLYDYVSRIDKLKLLHKLEEPLLGDPYAIRYKGKVISQDLCNSVYEFYSAKGRGGAKNIAELGAGYGRLSYAFLQAKPKAKYTIIDIPPALFISQEYLSQLYPREKIFRFRPFASYKEIKREFESARIRFLMPQQMEYLPDKSFDLFLNISSLHEMTRPQIDNYLRQIDRLTRGMFYTKQWRKSRTTDNSNIKRNEYPIPNVWKLLKLHKRHPIQRMFFDALYQVK